MLGRLEVAWPNSFRFGPIVGRVSLTRNESQKGREWGGGHVSPHPAGSTGFSSQPLLFELSQGRTYFGVALY